MLCNSDPDGVSKCGRGIVNGVLMCKGGGRGRRGEVSEDDGDTEMLRESSECDGRCNCDVDGCTFRTIVVRDDCVV